MKNKRVYYISYDKVKLYDGDNFYYLEYDVIRRNLVYSIKYWDCNVMLNLYENRLYLKHKRLFSDKTVLKEYIINNELVVSNFDHIFID